MINAMQSIWNVDRNSLHTAVRQCVPPSDLSFTFFLCELFTSKFWCQNAFISLTLPDPCILIGELRYSWGAVKMFCSYRCWSCGNTDSAKRYCMTNRFVLVFHDCVSDMDHESVIKLYYIIIFNCLLMKYNMTKTIKGLKSMQTIVCTYMSDTKGWWKTLWVIYSASPMNSWHIRSFANLVCIMGILLSQP